MVMMLNQARPFTFAVSADATKKLLAGLDGVDVLMESIGIAPADVDDIRKHMTELLAAGTLGGVCRMDAGQLGLLLIAAATTGDVESDVSKRRKSAAAAKVKKAKAAVDRDAEAIAADLPTAKQAVRKRVTAL